MKELISVRLEGVEFHYRNLDPWLVITELGCWIKDGFASKGQIVGVQVEGYEFEINGSQKPGEGPIYGGEGGVLSRWSYEITRRPAFCGMISPLTLSKTRMWRELHTSQTLEPFHD